MSRSNEEKKLSVVFPPYAELLHPVREMVACLAHDVGFPPPETELIVLAIDEALSNSVRVNEATQEPLRVELTVLDDGRGLSFSIEDNGSDYTDILEAEFELEQHLREMRSHGLGLHIIRTVMDTVNYERTPHSRNQLTLIKFLPD